MKIRLGKYIHSFSTKLSLYILLVVVLVFVTGFVWNYRTSRDFVSNEAIERVQASLDGAVMKIDNVLNSVETAVKNMSWVVSEGCDDPESMYKLTRMMLVDNPFISGSAVELEPNYFKEKGLYFSPHSYRDEDRIHNKQ